MLSKDDINYIKSLSKDHAVTLLRICLITDCFRAFTMLSNIITVSASLKSRQKTYENIYKAMLESGIKDINSKDVKNKNTSNVISFLQAVKGIKSLSSRWSTCSDEDIFSLIIILDANHVGSICWNDICLLGEVIYDAYRRNVTIPMQTYEMLYRNIVQALENLCTSLCSASIVRKLRLFGVEARNRGLLPLQLLETYLAAKLSSDSEYYDNTPDYSSWTADFIEKLNIYVNINDDNHDLSSQRIARDLFSSPRSLYKSKSKPSISSEVDSSRYMKNVHILSSSNYNKSVGVSNGIQPNLTNLNERDPPEDVHAIRDMSTHHTTSPIMAIRRPSGDTPLSVFQIAASPSSTFYENDSFDYSQPTHYEDNPSLVSGVPDISSHINSLSFFQPADSKNSSSAMPSTRHPSPIHRGLFLNNSYPSRKTHSANMTIFRTPLRHQIHGNVNTFNHRTLKWNPTKQTGSNPHFERFQSHTDVLWAKKMNGVFDQIVS